MAAKPTRSKRSEWHLTTSGTWTRSFGGRGYRVRLFQNRKGGVFYRAVWVVGRGNSRASLHTTDRTTAEQHAKALVAALLMGNGDAIIEREIPFPSPQHLGEGSPVQASRHQRSAPSDRSTRITLQQLWERYALECDPFTTSDAKHRSNGALSIALLSAAWGASKDVRTLTGKDVAEYVRRRRMGGLKYRAHPNDPHLRVTNAVNASTAHRDLCLLRTMLRWAKTVVLPNGQRWLEINPLDGMRFDKEKNPRRPVSTEDRYHTTRQTLQRLVETATTDHDRVRWMRLDLAIVIVNATGRRRGAIAGLRWEDFDFTTNHVTWRAEFDKKDKEWIIPMPSAFMADMRDFQRRLGSVSGFLFPSPRSPHGHIPADMLSQWLLEAEQHANLPKLKGGLWHPYRRKWASERMHLPLKAVADAGGWKDVTTLMKCYQHSDDDTLLRVIENHRSAPEHRPPTDHAQGVGEARPRLALVR